MTFERLEPQHVSPLLLFLTPRLHVGTQAFQSSRHAELLEDGDHRAPTCVTCHRELGEAMQSPQRVERECAVCHGEHRSAVDPDPSRAARRMLEQIKEIRTSLKKAARAIERVNASERRTELQEAYHQAEAPLLQAADKAHAVTFDAVNERLSTARHRGEELLDALAGKRRSALSPHGLTVR